MSGSSNSCDAPVLRQSRQWISRLCGPDAAASDLRSTRAADVQSFFDRWTARLPSPLMTAVDRAAGIAIGWRSTKSRSVSRRSLSGPSKAGTFEAVIRDNLDLGRPDRVGLLFPHRITRRTPTPTCGYRTRVITDGVEPSLQIDASPRT